MTSSGCRRSIRRRRNRFPLDPGEREAEPFEQGLDIADLVEGRMTTVKREWRCYRSGDFEEWSLLQTQSLPSISSAASFKRIKVKSALTLGMDRARPHEGSATKRRSTRVVAFIRVRNETVRQ